MNDENVYHILKYPNVEYDPTLYGEVEDVYEEFSATDGAHPYSALEGITIDCITGEIVSVQQFLDDSTSEIGEQLQKVLGFDSFTPDNWDYYITDTTVVFFYDDPKYWDSVVTRRRR